MAVEYTFYTNEYHGTAIAQTDWEELEARAQDMLARYKRIYTVESPETNSEAMAICAMAEALDYFTNAANGLVFQSSSIGSVSSTRGGGAVDTSPAAQNRELYRSASLYLNIYRGV
ncbi:MAG: hypothetical protein KBS75_09345 [Bacteroidales bacterium]|nr:hypothetical protein [Candidatus Equimonas faecalis]